LVAIKWILLCSFDEDCYDAFAQRLVDPFDGICADALCWDHRHEIVLLDQLQHDLSPADELAIDV
jgi:hypothetical protein